MKYHIRQYKEYHGSWLDIIWYHGTSWYIVWYVWHIAVMYLNISWYIGILHTPSRDICWVMSGHPWKVTSRVDNGWTSNNTTILYFVTTRMLTSGHLMYRITTWRRHEGLCHTIKAPEQGEQQLLATEQVCCIRAQPGIGLRSTNSMSKDSTTAASLVKMKTY